MPEPFTLDDQIHRTGDPGCPACMDGYPQRCPCSGFVHATAIASDEEPDGVLVTLCDRCRRSREDLEEVA